MTNAVARSAPTAGRLDAVAPSSLGPILIFFVLAFSIPWAGSAIVIAQGHGVLPGTLPMEPVLIIGSWTPNLAAFLVLAFIVRRRGGIRELLLGWTRWNAAPGWYLVAASPLLIGLITIGIVRGILGQPPGDGEMAGAAMFATVLVLALISGATGEELGWRGFALPRLQTRMSALSASVVLGLLWSLWHLPLWFTGFGWEKTPFWVFTLSCVSFSVIATWVCNSTNARLVIVTLMHLFLNFGVFVSGDAVLIPVAQADMYMAGMLTIFAVAIVMIYGPATLSRHRRLPIGSHGAWENR
jgi:uncharacterized protein